MAMKKNGPGGCGCCAGSDCWLCKLIQSITIDGETVSNPCCELSDGTYVLDDGACSDSWSLNKPYYPGCTLVAGSPPCAQYTESVTIGSDANLQFIRRCDGPNTYSNAVVCKDWVLVLHACAIQISYADVAGTPTVTVTITQTFREIGTSYAGVGPNCSATRGSDWVLTDTYTLEVSDCDTLDGSEIPHTSRTMTTDSTNAGDTTTINYGGPSSSGLPTYSYSFCDPPTVTLALVA